MEDKINTDFSDIIPDRESQNFELIQKLKSDNEKLREALVGLVGMNTKSELELLEKEIKKIPVPYNEAINMINAIRALIDTIPNNETRD